MTNRLKLLGATCLALGLLPLAVAQGGAQSQPADPTVQAPTTPAPDANPAAAAADAASTPAGSRVFTGAVARQKSGYVLKAGNVSYKLDDSSQAKQYKGKNVQITGTLDKSTNTIHVEKIEASASM